jgi:hypothetical protein
MLSKDILTVLIPANMETDPPSSSPQTAQFFGHFYQTFLYKAASYLDLVGQLILLHLFPVRIFLALPSAELLPEVELELEPEELHGDVGVFVDGEEFDNDELSRTRGGCVVGFGRASY